MPKHGKKKAKPAQKRYTLTRRWETNAERKAEKQRKRIKKLQAKAREKRIKRTIEPAQENQEK